MSDQDALMRLEEWLEANGDHSYLSHVGISEDGRAVELRFYQSGPDGFGWREVEGRGPDLSTAIHAALDRAEEAGL